MWAEPLIPTGRALSVVPERIPSFPIWETESHLNKCPCSAWLFLENVAFQRDLSVYSGCGQSGERERRIGRLSENPLGSFPGSMGAS